MDSGELSAIAAIVSAGATVVLVAVTAWYAHLTHNLAKSAKESAEEATRSAGAAERSADASARAADLQEAILEPSLEMSALFLDAEDAPDDDSDGSPDPTQRALGVLFGVSVSNNGPTVTIHGIQLIDIALPDGTTVPLTNSPFQLILREPRVVFRGKSSLFVLRDEDRAMLRVPRFDDITARVQFRIFGTATDRAQTMHAHLPERAVLGT